MTADVSIIEKAKENALLLPVDAVFSDGNKNYAWVLSGNAKKPVKKEITVGMTDDQNIEVVSGITATDRVAVMSNGVSLEAKTSKNPFMPTRKKSTRTP